MKNFQTKFINKTIKFEKKFLSGLEKPLLPIFISRLLLENNKILFIAKNDKEMSNIEEFANKLNQNIDILTIPCWDSLPYDVSSPNRIIKAKRIVSLTKLLNNNFQDKKLLILTSFNALFIKNSPKFFYKDLFLLISKNIEISMINIRNKLIDFGYNRVEVVREIGEFSIRGDILDIFVSGYEDPFRINFFGSSIEKIVNFDPLSQRNIPDSEINEFFIFSSEEFFFNEKTIDIFKNKYKKKLDLDITKDFLYNSIIAKQKPETIEHYLELFHEQELSNIFEFINDNFSLKNVVTICSNDVFEHLENRNHEINRLFMERNEVENAKLLKPSDIYLNLEQLKFHINALNPIIINDFAKEKDTTKINSKRIVFSQFKNQSSSNVLEERFKDFIEKFKQNKSIIICINDKNKLENIINFFDRTLSEYSLEKKIYNPADMSFDKISNTIIFLKHHINFSVEINDSMFIAENDFLGTVTKKKKVKKRKAENFLKDLTTLNSNDFITHIDHGLGQYKSLDVINISGQMHDCLKIIYADGDKLYVPVENINLISKVSDEQENKPLDKLGSVSWQLKRKKIKKKIKDIAEQLINTAAKRNINSYEKLFEPKNFNKFVSRFPYELTDDQDVAIDDVLNDIYSGNLMDRLICGDVGFGKTEIALRASFIMASAGKQVAIVAPTTLLVEQHFKNFEDRFKGFGFNLSSLSRMTSEKDRKIIKDCLKSGEISIVIGTHSLLSKDIGFKDLGLLVIDEEQHFGVSQKERLKELQFNIHVLTLTATPIPRTLQLSLNGLKELSLITTPPINRLAVRTFVQVWDKIILRDALLREKRRNGQSFIVCPKIKDLEKVNDLVKDMAPELTISIAHGRLPVRELENSINKFYKKKCDILISTNIIESGIDVPNANTLIVYNADFFGLSQLYQLRGRVGRSHLRAYAYFTFNKHKILTEKSKQRLKVLKTLDNLGAGFSLANYDLDIRGAGNLLGDEQSGQIREIGYDLYQKLLNEAINSLKKGFKEIEEIWNPTINIGIPVLIPDTYVKDLSTRMSLYRKVGDIKKNNEVNDFLEELNERFGPPPQEVKNLIFTILIKLKCIILNIEYIDIGSKGILVGFRNNTFSKPENLIKLIEIESNIRVRKDQKLFLEFQSKDMNKIKELKKLINKISDL